MPTHESRTVRDTHALVAETVIMKDLVIRSISGIAVFAHHARRFSMTDKKIDRFVAEILATSLLKDRITPEETLSVLKASEKMLGRARNLYCWSCEAFSRTPEKIHIPPVLRNGLDRTNLITHCAERLHQDSPKEYHDIHYWQHVVISKLAALASMTLRAIFKDKEPYDIFAFFHKMLFKMADGLSIFEMVALVQLVEKEQLQLVNAQVSGNTLIEAPSLNSAVRRSEIFVISEPAPPPDDHFAPG